MYWLREKPEGVSCDETSGLFGVSLVKDTL